MQPHRNHATRNWNDNVKDLIISGIGWKDEDFIISGIDWKDATTWINNMFQKTDIQLFKS